MRDEMSQGRDPKEEDFYHLIHKIEVLTLQDQDEDAKISFFSNASDTMLATQEVRTNKLKELKSNITEMEKNLSKLQLRKYECKEQCSVLNDEYTRLKDIEEILGKELHDACAAVQCLEKDIKRLSEETRTSDEDAAILEKNRSLLWLYKNLTGVKWDYSAPSSGYAGSVLNSVNNCCKHFSYPAAEASAECVWGEIQSAAHAVWSDIGS